MQTTALIIAIITVIAVILFARRPKYNTTRVKRGKNGCAHSSNKNLNVTAMGDIDEYYLCELCNQKVKLSELNN